MIVDLPDDLADAVLLLAERIQAARASVPTEDEAGERPDAPIEMTETELAELLGEPVERLRSLRRDDGLPAGYARKVGRSIIYSVPLAEPFLREKFSRSPAADI